MFTTFTSGLQRLSEGHQTFQLNGIVELCWIGWALSDPSFFLNPEVLHHFHWMFWDHDVQWCISVMGAAELDFCFSLIQTLVGYQSFSKGISKLKQVTGHDHHMVQGYIIAAVAGSVPRQFLIAIRMLLDLRYLAQAPSFTTQSLERVSSALQEFHDNKEAIVRQGARAHWQIPKLEPLQSVVPSICQSGAVMQWSADVTEHTHVEEIKVPACLGNNQNYYSQIMWHLDRLDKCFCFDLATYIEQRAMDQANNGDGDSDSDSDEQHEPDAETVHLSECSTPTRQFPDYFSISASLILGAKPSAPKPYWTFATSTTGFHLATKPSLRLSVDEAAIAYQLPDLKDTIITFANGDVCFQGQHGIENLQIWHKVRLQQLSYHDKVPLPPQTLLAIPSSTTNPYGRYDSVIISLHSQSDWPKSGLTDHSVSQLQMIFHLPCLDVFLAYIQHFHISNPTSVSPVTGMYMLRRAVRVNGQQVGKVIPLAHIRSPAHLVPNFGSGAHSHLTNLSSYELSNEFHLNKYWLKEFYYVLCSA